MEGLHHEFNFPDTAATELDIVLQALATNLPADHRLHRPQGFKRTEVDVLAIHKRAQHFHQHLTGPLVAGNHPRLDHGIALPIAPLVLIVSLQSRETECQGSTLAVGAQAHVGPENKSISRNLVQRLDQALPKADKKLLIIQGPATAPGLTFGGEAKDQVNVRGHIQLPATKLTHAQHHHFLWGVFAGNRVSTPGRAKLLT